MSPTINSSTDPCRLHLVAPPGHTVGPGELRRCRRGLRHAGDRKSGGFGRSSEGRVEWRVGCRGRDQEHKDHKVREGVPEVLAVLVLVSGILLVLASLSHVV